MSAVPAIIMLSLCTPLCHAETISVFSENKYIYTDYEEFHANRAYYDTLLLEGYTICVDVGEEYADAEIARLTPPAEKLHTLLPSSLARGPSVPTESEEKRWYAAFYAPPNAYGEIGCIGH